MVSLRTLRGSEIQATLGDLARLRIEVFRAFPYLYDGDLEYEQRYLGSFARSQNAFVVAAFDGTTIVGASTASPLSEHEDAFIAPVEQAGFARETVYYCAESVLEPSHRGQGIGHRFFDAREEEGRRLGKSHSAFFGVVRPGTHPGRPSNYRPLDPFWRKRGYAPVDGAQAVFSWRDVGDVKDSEKSLQLWMHTL